MQNSNNNVTHCVECKSTQNLKLISHFDNLYLCEKDLTNKYDWRR